MVFVSRYPQVTEDIIQCAEYIANDSLDSALKFLDVVENTFEFLSKNPEIGAFCKFDSPKITGVRFWPIKGFEKYLIFYLPIDNGIQLIRVIHGFRDLASIFNDE